MREFDHDGLLLAEYQGKIFEKSSEMDCSTGIFMRRYLHSDLMDRLDANTSIALSLDVNEGVQLLIEQFGNSNYGKVKFSAAALFWIGYMYRYISYTREQPTGVVMKLFDYRQMNEVYYTYHTQDPEWCIKSLLDINHYDENIFDNNYRLKQAMLKKKDA